MAINNNIFPPAITTYMPAFLISEKCRLYFSITDYNNIEDLKDFLQVTITNQNTNETVLDNTKYPCEIMLKNFYEDTSVTTNYKYYIDILSDDIQGGFKNNQYYKVQIRFTGAAAANVSLNTPQAIDSWLAANLQYFSEWSSVCLIRGISQPILTLQGFDPEQTVTWPVNNVDIVGNLSFSDPAEQDSLKKYKIKLYDENNILLQDSGDIYTNDYVNINEINYTINYNLEENTEYYFTLEYETMNLYSDTITYSFETSAGSGEELTAILAVEPQEENGRFKITLTSTDSISGDVVIRRSSSRTNFTMWEDVNYCSFDAVAANYTWYDYTIESGVFYKYIAQKKSNQGRGIPISAVGEPFMILFNDIFIVGKDRQLKIKFDPNINSFRRTFGETHIETIGSQYPFIYRNSNINYIQFSLNGTISCLGDDNNLFTSKSELLGSDNLTYYNNYNNNEYRRINEYNDWVYEREFRNLVINFLTNNEVKLFKSTTEGNFLVKILDVNLTPNQTLGRRIYNFSATVYEIDEYSFSKCKNYQILLTNN